MDSTFWELMRSVDTPTVCNAIEVVQGKRGFSGFTKGTVLAAVPDLGAICGYARTARIAAAIAAKEPPEVVRARRMDYYRHMASGGSPRIAVVEDVDFPACVGAFWGEVNTTVHKGFGLEGTLTNGVMRDLGDLAEGFQVIAGSIGPSHAFVHVTQVGGAVEVFGLRVEDGDLVHADRHGAVVIPPDVIEHLATAIETMRKAENLILQPARQPGFDIEAFEIAWRAFEEART
ncbi:RraA family protein [Rhizobium sp. SYY.PMSO]|uniref:RraA family protein n=1 Tax=Rhizobium sp. SYY.PMSO TaxID=3382192 RepID=UPI00398FC779